MSTVCSFKYLLKEEFNSAPRKHITTSSNRKKQGFLDHISKITTAKTKKSNRKVKKLILDPKINQSVNDFRYITSLSKGNEPQGKASSSLDSPQDENHNSENIK